MPVLGHAFVGVATAAYIRPRCRLRRTALWMPVLVGLAYLPDITSQICDVAGAGSQRAATHSVLFAVIASVALAWPVAALAGFSWLGGFGLAFFSVLLHEAMDLSQGTDDAPFWPFSAAHIDLSAWSLPDGLRYEVLWFGGACVVLVAVRWLFVWLRGPRRGRIDQERTAVRPAASGLTWAGWVLTAVILLLAAGTHYLREVREQQVAVAESLIEQNRPAEALSLLDQAARWPHLKSRARLEAVRGDAYAARGDRYRAEQCYLAALAEDEGDFSALADLATLYATSPEPLEQRRRRVDPLVARLRADHADEEDLPKVLATIEKKLSRPATQPASSPSPAP